MSNTKAVQQAVKVARVIDKKHKDVKVWSIEANPGSYKCAVVVHVQGGIKAVDALAESFELGPEEVGHLNYVRLGEFEGQTLEVYSGRR
jgi:hypothetical protein